MDDGVGLLTTEGASRWQKPMATAAAGHQGDPKNKG